MTASDIFVVLLVVVFAGGFIYVSFIAPKREKKHTENKQNVNKEK